MKALILAAGQGTRLRHLTDHRAKPMLPIHGKPLLQHIIEWLRHYEIRRIAVNLHHHPDSVVEAFGDGLALDVRLHYSYEPVLMGTAGAAKLLEDYFDERFVVVYGDVYTNLDLARLQRAHARHCLEAGAGAGSCLTLAIYAVTNPEDCGLVETDVRGRVTRFVEKPPTDQVFTNLAFTGILIAEPGILAHIPHGRPFDFGHDLIPRLLDAGAPLFAESLLPGEFVIDIGTLGGYLLALQINTGNDLPWVAPQPEPVLTF